MDFRPQLQPLPVVFGKAATGLFANISAVLVAVSTRNVTMFILFEVINLKYWEMSLVVKARRWAED